jgi:predicted methyltransferase
MKLKEIFDSYKINGKIKLLDKNYNKSIIKSIYDENIMELINILEMTVMQLFEVFRDLKETKLVGFERMDTVIKELEYSEKDKEYINKLKRVILSFENYYFKKEKLKSKINN